MADQTGISPVVAANRTKAPFSDVQSSSAIQKPTADGGSVYRNVESLWHGTVATL